MGLFRRRGNTTENRPAFVPPPGLTTTPQRLVRSVPFTFVDTGKPAVNLSKDVRDSSQGISLVKQLVDGYDAMKKALEDVGMAGLRCEVIVMVDDSGSIMDQWKAILRILVLYLGAALNLSVSGKITVLLYSKPDKPIVIDLTNYQRVAELIVPGWGGTPMGATLKKALKLAEQNNCLTIIGNLTDGNPTEYLPGESYHYDQNDPDAHIPGTTPMSNATIESSGHPVMIKNLAVKKVPYLVKIDDLPSQIEIEKDDNDQPVKDAQGNLILYRNDKGIRLIDNVDSQEIPDPFNIKPEEFAPIFAEEIESCIEVMAHAGHLTGVPGHSRTF